MFGAAFGAIKPEVPAPAVTSVSYDLTAGIPSGVTFARASTAWYLDASGVLQTASANTPRYSHDPVTLRPLGLSLEPSSANWVKSSNFAGAVAASDLTQFNTLGNKNAGPWGTWPNNFGVLFPGGVSTPAAWQIAGLGTINGMPYLDLRVVFTNDSSVTSVSAEFGIIWGLSGGVAAAPGDTWTASTFLSLVAGDYTPHGNVRLQVESMENSVYVQGWESGLQLPAAAPAMNFYKTTAAFPAGTTVNQATASLRIAVPQGESVDITLRLIQPQLEKQGFATTPIPTTNGTAGTPVRALEHLTVAIANGAYNVRWLSNWKNFDQLGLVASGGHLTLTAPAEALALGIADFNGLYISPDTLPPDPKRLRWARPALGDIVQYVTVAPAQSYLPGITEISPKDGHVYGSVGSYEPDVDVVLTLPALGLDGHVKINGGRRVFVIGGQIAPTDPNLTAWCLSFGGVSELIWIEGVHINGGLTTAQLDGIDAYGTVSSDPWETRRIYTPDIYIQKCRVENIHGHKDNASPAGIAAGNLHADGFQIQGPMGRVFIDLFTVTSSYQGIFVAPQWFVQSAKPGPDKIIAGRKFSRVNVRYKSWDDHDDHADIFWLRDSDWIAKPPEQFVPTELIQVWAQPNPALGGVTTHTVGDPPVLANGFFAGGVWPGPLDRDGYTNAIIGQANATLAWPTVMQVNGCVWNGAPPGGDWVGVYDCGIGYVSPGYVGDDAEATTNPPPARIQPE